MKRLLMISYPFPPNATAGAVRSERFARYLPRFGWEVDVVTIKPRGDLFADAARLENLGASARVHATSTLDPWLSLQSWRPSWYPLRAIRGAGIRLFSFPDHMTGWIPFAVVRALRLHSAGGYDAVYTTSPPHSTHLAGLMVSRWTHKPLVADFRDPWTLNAYPAGPAADGALGRLLRRIEERWERKVLTGAAAVLANTEANRNNLLKAFTFLPGEKVILLPNGWEPFDRLPAPQAPHAPLTIVHAGVFYPRFRPFGLLHAIARWKQDRPPGDNPRARVVLLGCRDAAVRKLVEELSLEDVVEFRPWTALGEARGIMCRADLLWTTLGTGKEAASYVPSKIYEYIAAGRPIIGFFPEGEAAQLIRETGAGVVFSSDEPAAVIRVLEEAVAAKALGVTPDFYKPRADVIQGRRIDHCVRRLASLLDRITAPSPSPREESLSSPPVHSIQEAGQPER